MSNGVSSGWSWQTVLEITAGVILAGLVIGVISRMT